MGKYITPKVIRTNYIIKYPDKSRSSFSILVQIMFDDKTRDYEKFDYQSKLGEYKEAVSHIHSINQEWHTSDRSADTKKRLLVNMKEIRKELNDAQRKIDGRGRVHIAPDNQQILEIFFEQKITTRNDIVSHDEQKSGFTRAVSFSANTSMKVSKRGDLQKAIDSDPILKEVKTLHRRVCSRINSLLSFTGRQERLNWKFIDVDPFYISEENFLLLIPNIETTFNFPDFWRQIQSLLITLYYMGLRPGEAFGLQDHQNKNGLRLLSKNKINYISGYIIKVNCQMLKDKYVKNGRGKYTATKTKKARTAYLMPTDLKDRIEEWVNLDFEEKEKIRDLNFSHVLQKEFRKTFPKTYQNYEQMKPHDCRHSYAVNLLNKGINISQIVKVLGNAVSVCEKYYLTRSLSDVGLDFVHTTLTKSNLLDIFKKAE